jgi:superfamily II DNA helicase RecQ
MTIHSILKDYWGYNNFRPLQEEIVQAVLNGKDTLALMPTGGGKSVCFQVPAMMKEGLCLVVSPLIALMKDQVDNLRKKGITAFAIYSGMGRKEVIHILKLATSSNCKFLYVSPERLETNLFQEYLPALDINLIAVDEAHCISQWGYDFRPPYLRIAALREELPGIPILALTASATPIVQKDICEKLQFTTPAIFSRSFDRPNLSYSVFTPDSKINKITEILQKVNGSSIVYCKSRKRTKEISDLLNMHGITADFYHAGLQQDVRMRKQADWINNSVRTIVCTNAFGMGIDKPDVRVVVHADGSGEGNYYNFDFTDFVKKFKIDIHLAIYAIKALEQEGWVSYSEQIFLPSRVQFVTNKSWLYQFENDHPQLEPIIKTLLRTYEGIFDMPVNVHEKSIAYLMRREEADIIPELKRLHAYAIIEYIPRKDSPQLYLLLNRVRPEALRINMAAYEKRKQQFIERINKIIEYIHEGRQCRSQFIAAYFGDQKTKPCGICDNCLKQKDHGLSADEFDTITQAVFTLLRQQPVLSEVLPKQLPGIKKEKLYKVLDFLQSENKIYIDKEGYVKLA